MLAACSHKNKPGNPSYNNPLLKITVNVSIEML